MASDDVLDRGEFERRVTKVCAPGSGDPAAVSDAEDRRGTLLAHDAALRARIEELEGALELIVSYHEDETMPLNSAEANMAACARRAIDKGEDDG